nr:pumilio homolog 12-like [Tanacetum cinerariifolium]
MENERNIGGGYRRRWDEFGRNDMMMTSASYYNNASSDDVCNMFSSLSILPETVRTPVVSGESSGHGFYSGVGECTNVMMDPHHGFYYYDPMWYNNNTEVGFSGFDPKFDFDYLTHDLHRKEKVLDEGFSVVSSRLRNPQDMNKLISVCNDDHKLRIVLSLTNVPYEMVLICMSPHGTRAMQKLLENLNDPYQIALAMAALRPGASRLANDPNGHHVIQYCLIHFPSDVNEPILNEIAGKCYDIATDRSGCCVLQACIEHSQGEVRTRLVAEILANAIHLAEDPYGNYVLQHMVGLKVPEFTAQLVRRLKGNFASLSCNKFASNVVEKCLIDSGEEISKKIIMELLTSPNPPLLLVDPYANFVIQSALTVSTGVVYDCLLDLISDNMAPMRSNLYGRKILAWKLSAAVNIRLALSFGGITKGLSLHRSNSPADIHLNIYPLNLKSSSFVTLVVTPAMAIKKPKVTTFEEQQKHHHPKPWRQRRRRQPPASKPTKSGGGKQKK